jgi:hypothetical protein
MTIFADKVKKVKSNLKSGCGLNRTLNEPADKRADCKTARIPAADAPAEKLILRMRPKPAGTDAKFPF